MSHVEGYTNVPSMLVISSMLEPGHFRLALVIALFIIMACCVAVQGSNGAGMTDFYLFIHSDSSTYQISCLFSGNSSKSMDHQQHQNHASLWIFGRTECCNASLLAKLCKLRNSGGQVGKRPMSSSTEFRLLRANVCKLGFPVPSCFLCVKLCKLRVFELGICQLWI